MQFVEAMRYNQKVTGSISDGFFEIFYSLHPSGRIVALRSTSASNRNEYQGSSLGAKAAGA